MAKAAKYYVILTPSCDMARAKLDTYILVAKCENAGSLYKTTAETPDRDNVKEMSRNISIQDIIMLRSRYQNCHRRYLI